MTYMTQLLFTVQFAEGEYCILTYVTSQSVESF